MKKNWIVELRYRDLLINVSLSSKVTVLLSDSGSGKTFLSKRLKECEEVKDKITLVDAMTYNEIKYKIMSHNANGSDSLIIFDNADLYIDILASRLADISNGFVLIICKNDIALCNCGVTFVHGDCVFRNNFIKVE